MVNTADPGPGLLAPRRPERPGDLRLLFHVFDDVSPNAAPACPKSMRIHTILKRGAVGAAFFSVNTLDPGPGLLAPNRREHPGDLRLIFSSFSARLQVSAT